MHIVDGVAEMGHRLKGLILREALFVHLRARDPQAHHEAVGYFGANIGDDLAQEAQASVEIAAIGVDTQVDAGIQKLRRQIPMAGHDLDAVEAGRLHAPGCIAVALHDGGDHRGFERSRHDAKSFVGNRGGRVRHAQQAAVGFGNFAARMK